MFTPFGTQSYQLNNCQQAVQPANHGAYGSHHLAESWVCGVLVLIPLVHRDPLVLSTSCCLCWLTSAMTSRSCRKRCSGTGLTLLPRSSLHLRDLPAIQKPWASALETTTREELRQETWEPPETFTLSTSQHLRAKGRGEKSVSTCS